ncbi:MAG: tetratricopeptide repeat protein [Spirochaetales bacterium]|nr:tetratricopeptide repeat protein [Spirochaetales bacterium]
MNRQKFKIGKWSFIVLLVFLISLSGCDKNRDRDELLIKVSAVEEGFADGELSKQTIDELKKGIAALEEEINRTVDAGERLGLYYRAVASRYMDRDMFGLAADFFRLALDLAPTNLLIVYRIAVSEAQVANAIVDPESRLAKLEEVESYYLYALQLDPYYGEVLFGLSVLYIFELDMPADAEIYLERLLSLESNHYRGMFLLARVYVQFGRVDDAIDLYNRIVKESGNEEQVQNAKDNRSALTGDYR